MDKLDKQRLNFNLFQLDDIISLLLTRSPGINKKTVNNIKVLFDSFDAMSFAEETKEWRVFCIKKFAELRLSGVYNKEIMISSIDTKSRLYDLIMAGLPSILKKEITDADIRVIDNVVGNAIGFGFINQSYHTLMDGLIEFKAKTYDDFDKWLGAFNDNISELNHNINNRLSINEDMKYDVSFGDGGSLIDTVGKIIEEKRNPSSRIKTGFKTMNVMLDGGFEKSRLYMALGVAKGWKSGFLLNAVLWGKKYSNDITTNDKTKRPVILYVTQENSVEETIERIWSHLYGNNSEIGDYDPQVVMSSFKETGIFTAEGVEIIIKYRSNKSVSAIDLNTIIDDVETDDKEVVFLVQDYLKRLKPNQSSTTKELRIELGDITNELKTLAKEKNIPILTAMQMNRDSLRVFETTTDNASHFKAMKSIGASSIGESLDIIMNVDYAFIISMKEEVIQMAPQDPVTRRNFIHIKEVASRLKDKGSTKQFTHPFVTGNTMRIEEDALEEYSRSITRMEEN